MTAHPRFIARIAAGVSAIALAAGVAAIPTSAARADETCQSPYMARITGQEEFVYVWTLGVEGLGDGSDKLVTVDARPDSPTYGQVVDSDPVGGRHEAHHGGFTDDRRFLWLAGLDTSRIFVFDVHSDPGNPRLVRTIDDFVERSGGVVGPHGAYALPGRMLISGLSNDRDKGGRTGLVEYTNEGEYIATHWMPTSETAGDLPGGEFADGYGYDARVLPRKNVMLTSSFTGMANYMTDFGEMLQDERAMQRFGQSMVLWDFHARAPKQVFHVPGAPLEIRWANRDGHNYAFTSTALTSKLWLVYEDDQGAWQAEEVADIGDPSQVPLPVALTLSSDDNTLFVDTFMDGKVRVYDVSDPHRPRQIHEQQIGRQVNMVSQSWDGERVYFTSSLTANWDKKGDDNEQFLKAYDWDGERLTHRFTVDFTAEELGRPHLMRFGAASLYSA